MSNKASNELKSHKGHKRRRKGKNSMSNLNRRLGVVEQVLNSTEKKFIDSTDVTGGGTVLTSTATVYNLSQCGQGDTQGDRDGNEIHVDSILVRMMLRDNTSGGSQQWVRAVVVKRKGDTRSTTAAPGIGDVVFDSSALVSIMSPYDTDTIQNYKVIYDEVFVITDVGNNSGLATEFYWKNPSKGEKTTFSGTTDAIASTQDNHFFLILVADTATNGPRHNVYARCYFTDL